MKKIVITGTFDTKGKEFLYVKKLCEELGFVTITIHTGIYAPGFCPDIGNELVAAAGGRDIRLLTDSHNRALGTGTMAKGLEKILPFLYEKGYVDAVLSMGGSGGTSIAAPAMRRLPDHVPKIIISTLAQGDVSAYVGDSNLQMIPSIVDIAGLNRISRRVFRETVQQLARQCGITKKLSPETVPDVPLIAATMYGATTPCVTFAKNILEQAGYEVVVFHASGFGGRTMEDMIRDGVFAGVLDLTTTEWSDEICGGIMAAGKHRCEAAALFGVPQVVAPGAMDMATFGQEHTVPDAYRNRHLYAHNPMITVMRTNQEENRQLGTILAEKLNKSTRETVLLLPLQGLSSYDAPGSDHYGPEENQILFDTLKTKIDRSRVVIAALDCNINARIFGETAAKILLELLRLDTGEKRENSMGTILEQLRHTAMEKQFSRASAEAEEERKASSDTAQKPLTGVYRCRVCGYIFDEAAEGKSIDTLKECPLCHVGKEAFQQIR